MLDEIAMKLDVILHVIRKGVKFIVIFDLDKGDRGLRVKIHRNLKELKSKGFDFEMIQHSVYMCKDWDTARRLESAVKVSPKVKTYILKVVE